MSRYFLSLFIACLTFCVSNSSAAITPSMEEYLLGPVGHLISKNRKFTSNDILVRSREPGSQSRVIKLSEKSGKVLMLTFWRPCPFCIKHLRQLQALQQKMGKDRLEVIAINSAYNEPFDLIANQLKQLGFDDITPVQARDSQVFRDMAGRVSSGKNLRYKVTWIIDPQGNARFLTDFSMNWTGHPDVMALLEALADGHI